MDEKSFSVTEMRKEFNEMLDKIMEEYNYSRLEALSFVVQKLYH